MPIAHPGVVCAPRGGGQGSCFARIVDLMPLTAGQSLSFYEILGSLGAGRMGEVYRARDTRLEREVAIKVLPEELADERPPA